MCEFKPGDEVVCVATSLRSAPYLSEGKTYQIAQIIPHDYHPPCDLCLSKRSCEVVLVGVKVPFLCLCECSFKKPDRRNDRLTIEAFSVIKDGFEEPKRTPAPAKKRERAQ